MVRVSFQGEPGAFSEAAIRHHWHDDATPLPVRTFADVLSVVQQERADLGVLPVWNSSVGDIGPALETLRAAIGGTGRALVTVGEIILPVRQHLLALPGASLRTIRYVGSHPAALAQCSHFLAAHPELTSQPAYDTAGAARQLAELGRPAADRPAASEPTWHAGLGAASEELAVIASDAAARRFDLAVLVPNVQDVADNVTRFVIVSRRAQWPEGPRW